MLYNEEEVLQICKKYDIETVEKEEYPLYMDNEMDENFSFSKVIHQPVKFIDEEDLIFSIANAIKKDDKNDNI